MSAEGKQDLDDYLTILTCVVIVLFTPATCLPSESRFVLQNRSVYWLWIPLNNPDLIGQAYYSYLTSGNHKVVWLMFSYSNWLVLAKNAKITCCLTFPSVPQHDPILCFHMFWLENVPRSMPNRRGLSVSRFTRLHGFPPHLCLQVRIRCKWRRKLFCFHLFAVSQCK